MTISPSEITAVILAGGLARRMGGVDKGLQQIDGKPMVQRVLNRVQLQVGNVIINANRHLDEYQRFGVPVCSDIVSGYAGPLAGTHAALLHTKTPYLVSVPCDSPLLPKDLVSRLSSALNERKADAAVVVTVDGEQQQRHPVFMMFKTSLQDSLEAYLSSGARQVDHWLESIDCIDVYFEDAAAFTNVNTPSDMDALATKEASTR